MNRQLLARATEGTSAPTPGYLYNDLSQAAQSSPTAASEMVDYLVNRLQNTHNVHTKTKSLTVIAKLCDASIAFKRALAQRPQHVQALKDAVRHQGQPDPVCGDALHAKVRQSAQAALDAVYRADPIQVSNNSSNGATMYHGHSPAYGGHSNYSGGGAYGNNSNAASTRMEGIGNPRYKDPRLEPQVPTTITEVAREAGDVILGMIKDPLARNHHVGRHGNLPGMVNANKYNVNYGGSGTYGGNGRVGELYGGLHGASNGGYAPNGGGNNRFQPPPGAAQLAQQTGGQWTMASNRGPNAVQRTEREQDHYYPQTQPAKLGGGHGGVGGSWGAAGHSAPSLTVSSNGGGAQHGAHAATNHQSPYHSAPATDGTYEKNLILELCPPGGLKAVPPPDKLAAFSKMLPSLNPDLVCPVLLDCLEEGQPWIVRAKALCVMETCLRLDGGGGGEHNNPYRNFFHACQSEIVPLTAHARVQIKDPAKRVVALMGGATAGFQVPEAAAPAPVVNLLDFDDEPAPAPVSALPAPPASQDMFGGMQIKSKSDVGAAASAPTAPAAAVGVAAASPEPSLLDFANDAPAAPATAAGQANDIFRDMGIKETQSTGQLFQNMSLKDGNGGEDKKSDSEDAGDFNTMTTASGSAFGFINNNGSKDDVQHGAKPNFDPLTGPPTLSPSATAKTLPMMQSQEQMQAMAYQQMLMQQRMQMQMAYAMQQQGGRPMPFAGNVTSPTGMMSAPNLSMMSPGTSNNAFARPAKTDDHKFDFVKDAMKTQVKK
ncbi:hypothetical protein MPSEU_000408500 [Mayamaea pseudoterrestris]|nr:hypothetical protein MPSEU_000408500 [Mayamaea pseudoterrestris]